MELPCPALARHRHVGEETGVEESVSKDVSFGRSSYPAVIRGSEMRSLSVRRQESIVHDSWQMCLCLWIRRLQA